jgi:3-phosphoshikimate 1-carboxyvinyltransferase
MTDYLPVRPAQGPIVATVRPPGSKSQTIRALVAAALAPGMSHLVGALDADDTSFARSALAALGVAVGGDQGVWTVEGTGGDLRPPPAEIDAGASGLTARALIAISPLVDGKVIVVGRDRLPERPMGGLVQALRDLGVDATSDLGHLPVTVMGTGRLPGGRVEVDSTQTSQFASALLLAAPMADGPLSIEPSGMSGSHRYLEITLATMRAFGARVTEDDGCFLVEPSGYQPGTHQIEPDASAAVYPMAAAAITGGRVNVEGLGSASLQPDLEIAHVFEDMGCNVSQTATATTIEGGDELRPVDVDLAGSPDGALAVAVTCLFAGGTSRLRGLGSLRFKESDRLAATADGLERLGATARVEGDDLVIVPGRTRGARIDSYGDHRIAMSFALAGLRIPGVEIANPGVVAKTWPGFWETLAAMTDPGGNHVA